MGIEGIYLNIVKAIYDKLKANIILHGEKLKAFPPKIMKKTRVSTFTTIIHHSFGSPSYGNQRSNKRNPDQKVDIKLSLFVDDVILYIENPKDTIRKLLELISEFNKIT